MSKLKTPKGFTLIELIAVMVIIAIIISAGAFFLPFIKLLFYPPRQTDAVYVSNLMVNYLTEGNPYFQGLRYTRKITPNSAGNYYLRYTEQNNKDILLTWDAPAKQITYKFYGSSDPYKPLVYDAPQRGVKIEGLDSPSKIFKYLDENGVELPSPVADVTKISQIELNWLVYTGTGNTANGDGRVEVKTSVEIRQFE